jgi:hypothetical protein
METLLSPAVLFFALGFGAAMARSDLVVPDAIAKGLSLYLMVAIGLRGGFAVAENAAAGLGGAAAAGIALSAALPLIAFVLARQLGGLDRLNAAAVAGHYGSVSIVTFATAAGALTATGIVYEGYMPAVMALMETPAIVTALLLARGSARSLASRKLWHDVALNGSVVAMLGSFAIGWASGEAGHAALKPFVYDLYTGLLCLFLLDMGLVAARQLRESRSLSARLIVFAIVMPVLGGTLGLAAGWSIGLSAGGVALFGVLGASASYIAVPAVMRMALPEANPGIYVTLSLAITFPFNIVLGIPLYIRAAVALAGG